MWLLDTRAFVLCPFSDDNLPRYAILSHTWGDAEVAFQDVHKLRDETYASEEKAGYAKIKGCCTQAVKDGFKYAWIDTCCIDKSNSSELLEAINSMFKWYRNAAECYAYLEDVEPGDDPLPAFSKSRWFTRGWTLQELIAPRTVRFFNCGWLEIGTKKHLSSTIKSCTGIPYTALEDWSPARYSIAQKMSWAANRKTTRSEDMAYSLIGLFGVSMPMVYGEGEKAFIRLQLEIMKTSTDHSLFAWKGEGDFKGPLAKSPKDFEECGLITSGQLNFGRPESAYEMTNVGLRITLLVSKSTWQNGGLVKFAFLNCNEPNDRKVGIWLREVVLEDRPTGLYVRTSPSVIYPDLEHLDEEENLASHQLYLVQPDFHSFDAAEAFGKTSQGDPSQLLAIDSNIQDLGDVAVEVSSSSENRKISEISTESGHMPVKILETVGTVIGVATFGLQLAQLINNLIDEYSSPDESLVAVIHSVQATNDALDQVRDLLEDEKQNRGNEGRLGGFSDKALQDVMEKADSCLRIFWRIEATILNKNSNDKLELEITRRLSKFHLEIKENKQPSGLQISKTTKLTTRQRFRLTFSWKSKLEKYTQELHKLQTTLILIFHVVSLSLSMAKPKVKLEDMQELSHLYLQASHKASQLGLSEVNSSPPSRNLDGIRRSKSNLIIDDETESETPGAKLEAMDSYSDDMSDGLGFATPRLKTFGQKVAKSRANPVAEKRASTLMPRPNRTQVEASQSDPPIVRRSNVVLSESESAGRRRQATKVERHYQINSSSEESPDLSWNKSSSTKSPKTEQPTTLHTEQSPATSQGPVPEPTKASGPGNPFQMPSYGGYSQFYPGYTPYYPPPNLPSSAIPTSTIPAATSTSEPKPSGTQEPYPQLFPQPFAPVYPQPYQQVPPHWPYPPPYPQPYFQPYIQPPMYYPPPFIPPPTPLYYPSYPAYPPAPWHAPGFPTMPSDFPISSRPFGQPGEHEAPNFSSAGPSNPFSPPAAQSRRSPTLRRRPSTPSDPHLVRSPSPLWPTYSPTPSRRPAVPYPEYYDGRSFNPHAPVGLADEDDHLRQLLLEWTPAGDEQGNDMQFEAPIVDDYFSRFLSESESSP